MVNKSKNLKEIKSEIVILKKSLMNLKFQKSTGQLEKTSEIKIVRHKIARLKTKISNINGENGKQNSVNSKISTFGDTNNTSSGGGGTFKKSDASSFGQIFSEF